MVITEVRVKLVDNNHERLVAFVSITLDNAFVVRDLKVIDGRKGWFVSMPSRKLMDRCPRCRHKNHLRARFCNQCGSTLDDNRAFRGDGQVKIHADVAHPTNSQSRYVIETAVMDAVARELQLAQMPDYVCTYDEF